jgi:hypothetical protein
MVQPLVCANLSKFMARFVLFLPCDPPVYIAVLQGAGRHAGASAADMTLLNRRWLEDMAVRLLCLCALDRFGDFVGDQGAATF